MNKKNQPAAKRPYTKPAIAFSKKIEIISAVCDSGFGGLSNCRKSSTPCLRSRA